MIFRISDNSYPKIIFFKSILLINKKIIRPRKFVKLIKTPIHNHFNKFFMNEYAQNIDQKKKSSFISPLTIFIVALSQAMLSLVCM